MAKSSFRALLIAATLLAWSVATQAAGLGKLTVLSNLGQPLRAEIDVVAVDKSELDTLAVRLASIDAYLQNNLPYPSPSVGLKLALEKRSTGEPYISATTAQPVNEPFVDILVELTWNGGRILRAYTALLDPPTYAVEEPAVAAAPAAAPETAAPPPEVAPEPQVQTQMGSELQPKPGEEVAPTLPDVTAAAPGEPARPSPAERPAEAGMPAAPKAPVPSMSEEENYGPVKYGDTLSKIARKYKPDDITLEQMLVVLFRNNPEAFSGKNMNRLKTGKVLTIPDVSEIEAMDAKEARQEVRMQIADWRAYKQRLAEAAGMGAPGGEQAGQAAGGQVSPMVQDKGPGQAGQPSEVLKLSKGATTGAAAQERIRSLEEEVAARDRTIAEQRERVVKLEKTIQDMQALMEIKSKQGADLQKPAMSKPGGAPTATAPPTAAVPPPPPPTTAAVPPPPVAASPTTPDMSATAPAPSAGAPMAASAPASAGTAKPAATKPRPPKVAAAPPPTSLVDQVLGEPMYLGAGAAALALVGFLGFRIMRRRRGAADDFEVEAEKKNSDVTPITAAAVPESGAGIAAAARAAAAAGAAPVTEEVDPLAEAEIYLAYGRDAQAEEILREAVAANPRRHEIRLKLLELYAKRKDAAAFDPIARELQGATGGQGEVWEQAVRLGYQIDPTNTRYAAGKPTGAAAPAAAAPAAAAPEERLDFNIGLDDADVGTKTDIDLSRLVAPGGGTTTDIDLGSLDGSEGSAPDIDLSTIAGAPERTVQVPDVDFDLQGGATATGTSNVVDFDFDLGAEPAPTSTQILEKAPSQPDAGEPNLGTVEFDLSKISLDLGDAGKMEPSLEMGTGTGGHEMDLSAINLDLGGGMEQAGGGEAKDDRWYDVQTKFDLAKAYQEMGDKEGAREILREVMAEGDDEQKAAAQRVLETID